MRLAALAALLLTLSVLVSGSALAGGRAAFRAERDRRLAETDWTAVRAYERGEPVPEAWVAYRQALRDLPEQLTDEQVLAGNIPWPEPPKL